MGKNMFDYQHPSRNGLKHKDYLIKVTGEGIIAVQPDTATINLGVVTEGKELIETQQQNSLISTKVINSLSHLGIPKKDLQTSDYRIESDYDYEQGKQIFRGYKITHILQVKMEDLSLIGKVVDTAVQNGVNYVANVQFTIKNREDVYQKALSTALINAIEKAKAIATTLGVTLVPTPLQVVESGRDVHPLYNQPAAFVKGIPSTSLEPGQLLIKAYIAAEFKYY